MSQSRRTYGRAAYDENRSGRGRAAYDMDERGYGRAVNDRERSGRRRVSQTDRNDSGRAAAARRDRAESARGVSGKGYQRTAYQADRRGQAEAGVDEGRMRYGRAAYAEDRRSYGGISESGARKGYAETAQDMGAQGREYIYGNTVRKIAPQEQWEQAPAKKPHPVVRKNREKAKRMSAGYVMFLAAALCAAAFILLNYIQLQSDLTNLTKTVADKEIELNSLRLANDEEYNRIIGGIDLEEIKRVAIGELGMSYAQEGQIVQYESEEGDYMRRVTESGK